MLQVISIWKIILLTHFLHGWGVCYPDENLVGHFKANLIIKIAELVDMSISEMVPLQIPMKKPIEKMIGVGADFTTVD